MEESHITILIGFLILSAGLSRAVFSAYEVSPKPMNASVQQTISISLSTPLSEGIFFTNTTTCDGTQNPITKMDGWNNATRNYYETTACDGNSGYYVEAASTNQVNVKICHCACANLTCSEGLCVSGTDYLKTMCDSEGSPSDCVGFSNATTQGELSDTPDIGLTAVDDLGSDLYQVIGANVSAGSRVYLRYWLDPFPDSAPSGVYNTTYKIIAVEVSGDCGNCAC
mgnify:CR=1 FL=1